MSGTMSGTPNRAVDGAQKSTLNREKNPGIFGIENSCQRRENGRFQHPKIVQSYCQSDGECYGSGGSIDLPRFAAYLCPHNVRAARDQRGPVLTAEIALEQHPDSPDKPPRRHRRTRPQLLSRQELDRRLNAVKQFDEIVAAIKADLGGGDQLSAIETRLVEAFAGSAITLDNLNARTLLGEPISLAEYAQTVSAMVRVASRLGCSKRFRDVTPPDPLQYAAEHAA